MFGVTSPKPIPYNVMLSPGRALAVVTPATATGSTYVSVFEKSATTFCVPFRMNAGPERLVTSLSKAS